MNSVKDEEAVSNDGCYCEKSMIMQANYVNSVFGGVLKIHT